MQMFAPLQHQQIGLFILYQRDELWPENIRVTDSHPAAYTRQVCISPQVLAQTLCRKVRSAQGFVSLDGDETDQQDVFISNNCLRRRKRSVWDQIVDDRDHDLLDWSGRIKLLHYFSLTF
jgi:hypothetical protein